MQQTDGAVIQLIQIPWCAKAPIPTCTEAQLNANIVKKQQLPLNLSSLHTQTDQKQIWFKKWHSRKSNADQWFHISNENPVRV